MQRRGNIRVSLEGEEGLEAEVKSSQLCVYVIIKLGVYLKVPKAGQQ